MAEMDIYKKQNMGNMLGFGQRPALLIIDFQNAFTDENFFGGHNISLAIENTTHLLQACRQAHIPVAHVRFATSNDGSDLGTFGIKVPRLKDLIDGTPPAQIVDSLKPRSDEFVSIKHHASAFFGTTLQSWLTFRAVDTLLISGCATSGCVRASTIDASAFGYRPMIVAECVGDRAQGPHEANLFDMQQRYADVVSLQDTTAYISNLR